MSNNIIRCYLCGSNLEQIKRIYNSDILECANCLLGYTYPIPEDLKSDYGGYSIDDYSNRSVRYEKRFIGIINKIMKYKKSGKALDIGSGFGLFPMLLDKYSSFQIECIEPHLTTSLLGLPTIKVHKKLVDDFLMNNNQKYDLITMFDVVEHFRDFNTLKKVRKICSNDSLVVIQFPNYKSIMAKICKRWSWWMVEDHVLHFSPKSAELYLKNQGYDVLKIMTYEDFDDFMKNLDGNFSGIHNTILRKTYKLLFYSLFIPIYIILRKVFFHFKYGGLILVFAKPLST